VDLDAFVAAHRGEWDRLDALLRATGRRGRLSGDEVDELVALYQRTATHLSVVRSRAADPLLVARLSALVARARGAVAGGGAPAWRDVARFLWVGFPTALWRSRAWWGAAAAVFLLVGFAVGLWVTASPEVQASVAAPEQVRQLVERDFEEYYSANPAQSFAAQVWTNNARVSALAIVSGVLLGVIPVFLLLVNAVNVGVTGGLMAANDRAGLFFGLITPHGLLELTAVFIAVGVGVRVGWTVVDPGPRRRTDALAAEGRAAIGVALGLVLVLAVSGVIEAFVTPSPLPTWARIAIGVVAEVAFLAYVVVLGRRGAAAGETGDVGYDVRGDTAPSV
jgi:uncharacterized membrane protein SpoIIM required for sporulation